MGKNAILHVRNEAIPEYFFRLVTMLIYNSNRSVTCDNWYSSIPLLEHMLQKPYNLPITGTIGKKKREIPAEFKLASKPAPGSKFCHSTDGNLTLVSFTLKKKRASKIVILVSSFLNTQEITDGKPNIVRHYNATKGGTDNFDKF